MLLTSFGILLVGSVLVFGPGLIAGWIAWMKGYRPWFWLLAMGPIGALVIALFPSLARAATPEEIDRLETRADWTGGILTGFTVLPMFLLPLVGVLFFLQFRSMAPPPPPMMAAPTVTAVPLEAPAQSEPNILTDTPTPATVEGTEPARQD